MSAYDLLVIGTGPVAAFLTRGGNAMVKVAVLDGMKLYVYANDHGRPHFHVLVAEYRAVIDIESVRLIRGRLPRPKLRKVLAWAKSRRAQLLDAWDRARGGLPVERIV